MDKTLRDEFIELKGTVQTFCAVQTNWNEAHDKHSTEVLKGIKASTDKLFTLHEKMIEKVSLLPCREHDTRMESIKTVSNVKIASVEKRVKWIWGIIGGGVLAVAFGFFIKIFISYLMAVV